MLRCRQQEGDAVPSEVLVDGDGDGKSCEDRKTHQTISSNVGEGTATLSFQERPQQWQWNSDGDSDRDDDGKDDIKYLHSDTHLCTCSINVFLSFL